METGFRAGTAIVFPGMGPFRFDDVARFMTSNPFARRRLARADEALGYSLVDRFGRAKSDYSEFAQLAFLVSCLALADWAEQTLGVEPDVCVGPSFGAKAVVSYVESLPFEDAVRMTARLAHCAEEYFSQEHTDMVTHSFVRTPRERLCEVLAELDDRGEWYDISCYVDEDFYMLTLREGSLEWLQRRLRAIGGLSLYTMRPPMHSSAFGPLRRKAEDEVIGPLLVDDPKLLVIADQDGALIDSAEGIRAMLLNGIVQALRWPEVVAAMKRLDVSKVYVCGQDSLFGRVPATTRNFEVVTVNPRLAMLPRLSSPA